MSSIGGSSSSGRQDEVVRRNRDEYQATENELIKKHHKEIRHLSEQHHLEIEQLKEAHEKQMKAMQEASHKAITKRDQRYQGEIDKMRTFHRQQLKNNSAEASRREELTENMNRNEKDQAILQMEARMEKLNKDYARALEDKEQTFQKNLELNQEAQKKGMADQRGKLEKAHNEELKVLREDRDRRIGELKSEYDSYRQFSGEERKRATLNALDNQKRASENLVNTVKREQAARLRSEESLRDGFEESLGKLRGRFEKSMNDERQASAAGREYLENDVRGRIGERISRLELKNKDLKEELVRETAAMNQRKQREIANLRDSFADNVEGLQLQRDEAVRLGNEKGKDEIRNINTKHNRLMSDVNRNYLQRIEDQNFEHREDMDMMRSSLKARLEQTQKNADRRVQGIVGETEMEKQRMSEKSSDSLASLRRLHADEIRNLRFQFEEEKNQAISRVKEMAQKREIDHQDQMDKMRRDHEKEILSLQDQLQKVRIEGDNKAKRVTEDLQRAHKLEVETQEIRHKDRLQALEVDHSNRMKNLNRRHEEKLDQMAAAVSKRS